MMNGEAISRLLDLPRTYDRTGRLIPHYWSLSTQAIQPRNRDLVRAIAEACGGIAFNWRNAQAARLCMEMREETGCKVALWYNSGYTGEAFTDWETSALARHEEGIVPDMVVQGFEAGATTATLAKAYGVYTSILWPDAERIFYHWGSWALSPWGFGFSAKYPTQPPATVWTCNAYHEDAAANRMVMWQNATGAKAAGMEWTPFLGEIYYRSVWQGPTASNWSSTVGPRPDVFWHSTGRQLRYYADRRPQDSTARLNSVYLWNFWLDPRTDLADVVREWTEYAYGWAGA